MIHLSDKKSCKINTIITICLIFFSALCFPAYNAMADIKTNIVESISVQLDLDKIKLVHNKDGYAIFMNTDMGGRVGQPELPIISIKVLMPPDIDFSTVKVTLNNTKVINVPGKWKVNATKPAAVLSAETRPVVIEEKIEDKTIYNADKFYPTGFLGMQSNRKMRAWRISEVVVYPFRYNPVQKTLKQLIAGEVVFTFKRDPKIRKVYLPASYRLGKRKLRIKNQVNDFDYYISEYGINPSLSTDRKEETK